MSNQKNKLKNKKSIRNAIQAMGILLAVLGFLSGYSIVNSLFFATAIVMGPIFCGWICPFGTLQDVFSRIGKRVGLRKRSMPCNLQKILAWMRYAILAITTLIAADFIFILFSLDPRMNLMSILGGNTIAMMGWIVMLGFLGTSMIYERPFCNHFCMEGAKYGLLSSLRPLTIVRDEKTCIDCNKCSNSCPMNIDVASKDQVRSIQCITCMECVNACPLEGTLKLSLVRPSKLKDRWKTVIAIAAAIIVVFLGATGSLTPNSMGFSGASTAAADGSYIIEAGQGVAKGVADGVYEGQGNGFRGVMTVEVTVEGEFITSIDVTESNDDMSWFYRAYYAVVPDIISTQTVDVDSVAGATYSSMGIKEGVADALINGGGTEIEPIVNDLPEQKGHGHKRR